MHFFKRGWHSTATNLALWATAIVLMTASGAASANYGGGGGQGFSAMGQNLINLVCDFIQSPIVTVVLAVALVASFVIAAMNEDKGTLSKVLKTLMYGFGIVLLPGLLSQMGFNFGC